MSETRYAAKLLGIGMERYAAALWQYHARRLAIDYQTHIGWVDIGTTNDHPGHGPSSVLDGYRELTCEHTFVMAVILAVRRENLAQQASTLAKLRWSLFSTSSRPYFLGWFPDSDASTTRGLLEIGMHAIVEAPSQVPGILHRILMHSPRSAAPAHPWLSESNQTSP